METTTMKKYLGCAAVFVILAAPAYAQVKVGVIIGATGPGASLGIPYKSTFSLLPKTLGGQPVEYIQRDDATDPTNGVKFARDLIVGDKVDLIIGSSSTPSSIAIADVAAQLKTPQIALASFSAAASRNPWVFTVVQPADLMMGAVADDMKIHGVKSVAFIGFSDSWGTRRSRWNQGCRGGTLFTTGHKRCRTGPKGAFCKSRCSGGRWIGYARGFTAVNAPRAWIYGPHLSQPRNRR
jgi:hypothetical protein